MYKQGCYVRTNFCSGTILRLIDASDKDWSDLFYYEIVVERPMYARGTKQIIKLSEARTTRETAANLGIQAGVIDAEDGGVECCVGHRDCSAS